MPGIKKKRKKSEIWICACLITDKITVTYLTLVLDAKTISLCAAQLSNSLFDFVKCKSRRSATTAKYR